MLQTWFIIVNDLNGVSKKRIKLNKINENWNLFQQKKNKIRINLTKFDENWDQKNIFLKFLLFSISTVKNYFHYTSLSHILLS